MSKSIVGSTYSISMRKRSAFLRGLHLNHRNEHRAKRTHLQLHRCYRQTRSFRAASLNRLSDSGHKIKVNRHKKQTVKVSDEPSWLKLGVQLTALNCRSSTWASDERLRQAADPTDTAVGRANQFSLL